MTKMIAYGTSKLVTCPICERKIRVTVTGKLFKHKSQPATKDSIGEWCKNTSPYGES